MKMGSPKGTLREPLERPRDRPWGTYGLLVRPGDPRERPGPQNGIKNKEIIKNH